MVKTKRGPQHFISRMNVFRHLSILLPNLSKSVYFASSIRLKIFMCHMVVKVNVHVGVDVPNKAKGRLRHFPRGTVVTGKDLRIFSL